MMVKPSGSGSAPDHTDRKLESVSRRLLEARACAKPVARQLWRFDDLRDRLYDSSVNPPLDRDALDVPNGALPAGYNSRPDPPRSPKLMAEIRPFGAGRALPRATAMMCGTFGARGGLRPQPSFPHGNGMTLKARPPPINA